MRVRATDPILAKLSVEAIAILHIEEAIFCLEGTPVVDRRPEHRSTPPTVWFVAPDLEDRLLFVAGLFDAKEETFTVRTARVATERDIERWNHGKW